MAAVTALVLTAAALQTPYDTVFEQLKNLAPRADAVAAVRGLTLRRDIIELRLDSGTAYLLTPVAGRTIGIAFTGAGAVSFAPSLTIERFNLRRVLGDSTLDAPVTAAVFIFTDTTHEQLARTLQFARVPSQSIDAARSAVGEALDYLIDGRSRSGDATLLTNLLNGTRDAYFNAYVERKRGESVTLQFDPTLAEEVQLFRRGKMIGQRVETICQFQRAEDLETGVTVASKQPEPLAVQAYDIDATIDGNYRFSARTTVQLTARQERQQWARFYLYHELDIDSVVSEAGTPLTFFRRNNYSPLWVRFEQPIGPGETHKFRVVYHGSLIGFGSALPPMRDPQRGNMKTLLDDWAFIKDTWSWFPRYADYQFYDVSLTFRTPKNLKFASIGRLVESRTDGDVLITRWMSEMPTNQPSFNIGRFEEFAVRDPRIPPVTVHLNSAAHRYISQYIPHSRSAQEQVTADVVNSLSFFQNVFGPPLFSQYYATEIPYAHGQAFPGLIHLTWFTFLGLTEGGQDESFRAHEMAHQWWGIGVEPASDRDAWISEGFAQFAGMWYMQLILRNNEKYFKMLRDSRDEIRRQRDKAVPLGLGRRAQESWRGSYSLITYQKGAWVLHMLRNMMLDTRTMSEDRFTQMMRSFYETYRGKRASTLDFQRTVEEHIGRPMDWFFDQWVNGTEVPTYTFAWKTDSAGSDGNYKVRIRVRQTDVPESFAMYVPLLIKFEDGEAFIRVVVRGPLTEATLSLPAPPKTMQLSPFESVLALVRHENW